MTTENVVTADVAAPEGSNTSSTEIVPQTNSETQTNGTDVQKAAPASGEQMNGSADAAANRVVRTLAVGQEVKGVVKRTSEFGAFIDIGVGRDGLVHVSELSTKRVAKVTDVLAQGQEATFWIKELDRERNRISLTMIQPGTKTIRDMQKGDVIKGKVSRIMNYGAFVDIGIGRDALLHVREMGERFVPKPEDVVKVGEEIDARIIELERRRARVDLSIKGLRPEPEPEPEPEPQAAPASQSTQGDGGRAEGSRRSGGRSEAGRGDAGRGDARGESNKAETAESQEADQFSDIPVMSAFEAAFKRARGEAESKAGNKSGKATNISQKARAAQEDILARTLTNQK